MFIPIGLLAELGVEALYDVMVQNSVIMTINLQAKMC